MPWLDQIIVLQDGRLIQNDDPEETYRNPYNEYVAKLFGEVNVFSDKEQNSLNLSKKFWYPNEIKITAVSYTHLDVYKRQAHNCAVKIL